MENEENKKQEVKYTGAHRWGWRSGGLMPGLVLILLGIFFLFSNFSYNTLENWWALFILIPAFNNLSRAWELYRHSGSLGRGVRNLVFWGVFFLLLSGAFLISIDFSLLWPIFLILAGIGMLAGAF